MPRFRPWLVALPVLLALPASAGAQERERLTPEPIEATAPVAVRAREIADLILAGDRTRLEQYLREHGAASYTGSTTFANDVSQLLDGVKDGARTIVRLDGLGGARVGVALGRDASASPERAIIVRMEEQAPHRITALMLARISIGGG